MQSLLGIWDTHMYTHAHTALEKQKLGRKHICLLGRPVPSHTAPDLPLPSLLLSRPLLTLRPPPPAPPRACSVIVSLPLSHMTSLSSSQENVPPGKYGVPVLASSDPHESPDLSSLPSRLPDLPHLEKVGARSLLFSSRSPAVKAAHKRLAGTC